MLIGFSALFVYVYIGLNMRYAKSCLLRLFSGLRDCVAYCVVGLTFLCFGSLVFAAAPVTGAATYNVLEGAYSTASAACNATLPRMQANYSYLSSTQARAANDGTGNYICDYYKSDGSLQGMHNTAVYTVQNICQDGSQPNTSQPLASQCPDVTTPATYCYGQQGTAGQCMQTAQERCNYEFFGKTATVINNPDGSFSCAMNGITGATNLRPSLSCPIGFHQDTANLNSCVSDALDRVGDTPFQNVPSCAAGFTWDAASHTCVNSTKPTAAPTGAGLCPSGTVNVGTDSTGTPICVGTQSSQPTPAKTNQTTTSPKTTSTDSSTGAVTDVQSVATTNADGSITTVTTTTVTQTDGTKKVTVSSSTGNNSSGKPGVSDAAGGGGGSGSDFCASHPELNVCRNSQVTGSCGSLSCLGDAIQCATLKAVAQQKCDAMADPVYKLAQTFPALDGAATAAEVKALNKDGSNDIDVNKKFDDAKVKVAGDLPMMTGGASCPAPMQIQVAFTSSSMSIPFDQLCIMAAAMRVFVILAAGMASLKIMFRVGGM